MVVLPRHKKKAGTGDEFFPLSHPPHPPPSPRGCEGGGKEVGALSRTRLACQAGQATLARPAKVSAPNLVQARSAKAGQKASKPVKTLFAKLLKGPLSSWRRTLCQTGQRVAKLVHELPNWSKKKGVVERGVMGGGLGIASGATQAKGQSWSKDHQTGQKTRKWEGGGESRLGRDADEAAGQRAQALREPAQRPVPAGPRSRCCPVTITVPDVTRKSDPDRLPIPAGSRARRMPLPFPLPRSLLSASFPRRGPRKGAVSRPRSFAPAQSRAGRRGSTLFRVDFPSPDSDGVPAQPFSGPDAPLPEAGPGPVRGTRPAVVTWRTVSHVHRTLAYNESVGGKGGGGRRTSCDHCPEVTT